jgi:hypothetical protein
LDRRIPVGAAEGCDLLILKLELAYRLAQLSGQRRQLITGGR